MAAMLLDFYYDVVCPYAYLASAQVEALAARTGATLRWRPVLLGGLFRHVGAPQDPAGAMHPHKARLNLLDMSRQADRLGLPLRMPAGHPRRSVEAMRLLTACPEARRPALSHALYRAYWVDGQDICDRAVLGALAAEHRQPLDAIDDPKTKAALFDTTAEAAGHGAFGVPALVIDQTRLYWGADRLHLVETALGGAPARPPIQPAVPGARVRFFHDLSSPFSYLAASQITRITQARGAHLEWVPILLGGLFQALRTPSVPLLAMSRARQRYLGQDLLDWAGFWGVDFKFNSKFPLRTVTAQRVALQAPEATLPLYRAVWAEDRDLSDPRVVAEVVAAAGLDAEALLAGAADPAVKALLKANTDAAAAAGACGVPSFEICVGDRPPLLVWGQDRLDMVGAALEGWRPRGE